MTQIPVNLDWREHRFQYLISIGDTIDNELEYTYITIPDEENIEYNKATQFLASDLSNLYKNKNIYTPKDYTDGETNYLPTSIGSRKLRFYFPLYNMDIYKYTKYSIKVTTWIARTEIVLGNYIVDSNRKACNPFQYKGERYYEYTEFHIPDPWSLIYDDEWIDWRHNICDEPIHLNNTGSSINISICPILENNGIYTITEGSDIGVSNSIISKNGDYMYLNLGFEQDSSDIRLDVIYNDAFDNIEDYLYETYGYENTSLEYEIVIKDAEDIYRLLSTEVAGSYIMDNESCIFNADYLNIEDWSTYIEGLFLIGSLEVKIDNEIMMTIFSNKISLTPDIYKYLIHTDIKGLNLNLVNMIDYNINAVNKINKTVVQVDNTKDFKSNIIKPVFFRANKIDNTIIHPEVTENICLNLNAFKSKVDFFYVKIEGVTFSEVGQNHNGVIFKIQGNLLPHNIDEGILYILNQDKELVTTGNFKYES